MYGMSVQQAIFNYSGSVIQGMQKYTKINSSNSSFSETLSKIDSAKSSGKKMKNVIWKEKQLRRKMQKE